MELQVCSAVNNIIEDKTGQSVATCWGSQKKKEALAAELVRRWNAFEIANAKTAITKAQASA